MKSHAPARADHASVATTPFWRREQVWRVVLPVAAAAAVVAALLIVLDYSYGSNGVPNAAAGWGTTYATPKPPKTVKLEHQAQVIATKFVRTAVARKNLDVAYQISGPHVREGMTLKQFMTGAIPVVPYKVTSKTTASMKIDKSYATTAQVELYLATPGHRGRDFYVDLVKKNGKWFVDGWVPRGTPPIPTLP
jgi:phage tail tape-measure protein